MQTDDMLRNDFRLFLWAIWKELALPEPTPIQYDIAEYLQNGPRRRVVEAFRGVGKSWITAAYVLWRLYCDQQLRILIVSATKERADNFTTFCRDLINQIEWLRFLKPREGQRDSKISFDVGPSEPHQQPSVKSGSITGQLAGSRAHEIVADDCEIPNNALTQGMREKLWEAVKEFDAILLPNGRVTYLGTPQILMSLYNELPNRGYDIRIWPSQFPALTDEQADQLKIPTLDMYGNKLAPMVLEALQADPKKVGKTTEPRRFTDMDLGERALSYGMSGYRLQFMLDTSLSDSNRYPLRTSDLTVLDVNPDEGPLKLLWTRSDEVSKDKLPLVGLPGDGLFGPIPGWMDHGTAPYTGRVMFIDPSGKGKDETGYAIVYMLHGKLYCPKGGVGGLVGGYDDTVLTALAKKAKEHQVKHILIESNFGAGMFEELLKPALRREGYMCTVEGIHSVGQKEARIIDTLEPVLNQHKLVIDPENIMRDYHEPNTTHGLEGARDYMLMHQLTHISRDKGALRHEDRLEALAGAVGYWAEQMAVDEDAKAAAHREMLLDQELAKFSDHVFGRGGPSREQTWIRLP